MGNSCKADLKGIFNDCCQDKANHKQVELTPINTSYQNSSLPGNNSLLGQYSLTNSSALPQLTMKFKHKNMDQSLTFTISPMGSSAREDSITNFGFSNDPEVDIVIPSTRPNENKYKGKLFFIFFDWSLSSYFLKDLGVGMGAFYKLQGNLPIRDNLLISFDHKFLLFSIKKTEEHRGIYVNLLEMEKDGAVYEFRNSDFARKNIKIGRSDDCNIRVNDAMVSKVQASFFLAKGRWILRDGNGREHSTNGTWIYADDQCQVKNCMNFKIGDTYFRTEIHS